MSRRERGIRRLTHAVLGEQFKLRHRSHDKRVTFQIADVQLSIGQQNRTPEVATQSLLKDRLSGLGFEALQNPGRIRQEEMLVVNDARADSLRVLRLGAPQAMSVGDIARTSRANRQRGTVVAGDSDDHATTGPEDRHRIDLVTQAVDLPERFPAGWVVAFEEAEATDFLTRQRQDQFVAIPRPHDNRSAPRTEHRTIDRRFFRGPHRLSSLAIESIKNRRRSRSMKHDHQLAVENRTAAISPAAEDRAEIAMPESLAIQRTSDDSTRCEVREHRFAVGHGRSAAGRVLWM